MSIDSMEDGVAREGRREPFKQLPDAVIDDENLSPLALVAYWYLKRIAGYGDHRARVSIAKLAERLGLSTSSRRTVREIIGELVTAGWVEVEHRKTPDGKRNLPSDYIVHATLGVGAGEPLGAGEPPPDGAEDAGGRGWGAPRVGAGEPHGSRRFTPRSTSKHPSADASDRVSAARADTEDPDLFTSEPGFQDQSERPEPSGAGSKDQAVADERTPTNAGHVTAAWVDAFKAQRDIEPTKTQVGRAARIAKELLAAGNDAVRVLEAARMAGIAGWPTIDQQLVRMTAPRNGADFYGRKQHVPYDDPDPSEYAGSIR